MALEHNSRKWEVCTNRHPTTHGEAWGWIEGATGPESTWEGKAGYERAAKVVEEHNAWLAAQESPALQTLRLREEIAPLRQDRERHAAHVEECDRRIAVLEAKIAALASPAVPS